MNQIDIKKLKAHGRIRFKSKVKRDFEMNNELLFNKLIDYLGLSKENKSCRLKGLLLLKEGEEDTNVGTELEGTWFSFTPAKGVVTSFEKGWKCHIAILDEKDLINRKYEYQIKATGNDKSLLQLTLIQHYPLTPFTILNPQVIQLSLNQILSRFVVPFDIYTDVKRFLPKYFLDTIAIDALPKN